MDRIIIVEGIADKRLVHRVLQDDVEIICTYGTFGVEKFDQMLERYDLYKRNVYVLVDEDEPGKQLRKQLSNELSDAIHLYIPEVYQEVEKTPENVLAQILNKNHFNVKSIYLML